MAKLRYIVLSAAIVTLGGALFFSDRFQNFYGPFANKIQNSNASSIDSLTQIVTGGNSNVDLTQSGHFEVTSRYPISDLRLYVDGEKITAIRYFQTPQETLASENNGSKSGPYAICCMGILSEDYYTKSGDLVLPRGKHVIDFEYSTKAENRLIPMAHTRVITVQ